ncbi:M56 family metallopeptidase [Parvularcula dongshanensis]|uniref:Beta-lactamase regulating signal transducer with metallopeptidase domain n=1 Tax=Parvularcula dongshanensis TaxID=1173995 RepID=A0A840I554_9PROT|nr:M56 family metallopeptidase [Parvularcula dongshanensis]MBB4659969.1 beta-lactamase regulating signal transducer with metallopeptidase domain [Parvularcula dongshanensis]
MNAEAFLIWLVVANVVGAILCWFVLTLRRIVRQAFGARAAVVMWLAPGLRLILPPLGLGLLAWPGGGAEAPGWAESPDAYTVAPSGGTGAAALPLEAAVPPEVSEGLQVALPTLPAVVLCLWVFGACVMLVRLFMGSWLWRRTLLAEAAAPSPALDALADEVSAEIGPKRFRLILSGAAASPQVMGVFAPLIAVPLGFEKTFTREQQRLALVHEVMHLRRGDLWTQTAARSLAALHWPNPLIALSVNRFRADQEAACDEAVRALGAPTADYAATLMCAARGPAVPALALNSDLKERIEIMRRPLPSLARRLLGTVAVLGLALPLAAATQTAQDGADAAPQDLGEAPRAESNGAEAMEVNRYDDDENGHQTEVVIDGESYVVHGRNVEMVLLSDPFKELVPEPPKEPTVARARVAPPPPPTPPVPAVRTKEDEEGTWILVPGSGKNDQDFSKFEEEMEAWSEMHGEAMGHFGEVMGEFGERMGAWGEKMGMVGEAVGELGRRCRAHTRRTDEPTVLEEEVEDDMGTVKAVCARGGEDRYASAALEDWVKSQRGLSAREKAAFMENRDGRGHVYTD